MFHWLKKKCHRQQIKLFSPEQMLAENEYHIYEEIPDHSLHVKLSNVVTSLGRGNVVNSDHDCPVCRYGLLDTDVPCVCEDQIAPLNNKVHLPKVVHSPLLTNFDKQILHFSNSRRPLPKIPNDLVPHSRKPVRKERVASYSSSSGYESNSLSSLDIEDDVSEILDKTFLKNTFKIHDVIYVPDGRCMSLENSFQINQNTSAPVEKFSRSRKLSRSSKLDNNYMERRAWETGKVWCDESIYL